MTILIHYAEIALKGKNRAFFERKLLENIKGKFEEIKDARVKKLRGRIILALPQQEIGKAEVKRRLKQVFGIAWFAFALRIESKLEKIKTLVKQSAQKISSKQTFAIRVKRADKSFPLQSSKVEQILGKLVEDITKATVNLTKPDKTLFLEINQEQTFVFWEKIKGLGGLPVGVSGKVICLFSGGIDSAVAAYLLAKRGAKPILVHFSAIPVQKVKKNKIIKIYKKLQKYIGETKLYIIPYDYFQLSLLENSTPEVLRSSPRGWNPRYEVLLFRRFMRKVAEKIAQKEKAQAIVTGDSLGQVASQTLENLAIFDKGAGLPIFRPLLGYDKQEIVNLAKKIGTYQLSILPYKDCCSIIQKTPITRGKLDKIAKLEKEIEMEKIVERSLKDLTMAV